MPADAEQSPSPRPLLERASTLAHEILTGVFTRMTKMVVGRPVIAIGAVLLFVAVMAQGFWFYEEEYASEKQFVPRDSRAAREETWVQQVFGHDNRVVRIMFVSKHPEANVLTREAMLRTFEYMSWVEQLSLTVRGVPVDYQTICARSPGSEAPCKSPRSPLALWDFNATQFRSDPNFVATLNREGGWRRVQRSGPDLPYYFGGVGQGSGAGQDIGTAAAMQMLYFLRNRKEKLDGIGDDDLESREFELELGKRTRREWADDPEVSVHVISFGEQRVSYEEAMDNDARLLVIGYIIMLFYASFVLFRGQLSNSHAGLGIISVMCVGCSTVSAYGFCLFFGVKFNPIIQTLIIILLGVGVDDTFVIMESWWAQGWHESLKERMIRAVSDAGTAITVTSVTDLVAFLAGSATSFPALRDFCKYAAVGISFDFAFQCTLFVALAFLDTIRSRKGRLDLLCCVKVSPEASVCPMGPSCLPTGVRREGVLRHAVGVSLPRALLGSRLGRAIGAVFAVSLLAVGTWGCAAQLRMNYDDEWFVQDGTDAKDDTKVRDKYFTAGRGAPLQLYFRGDLASVAAQKWVYEASAAVSEVECVERGSLVPWTEGFSRWVNTTEQESHLEGGFVRPESFHRLLREYIESEAGERDEDSFRWGTEGQLVASRVGLLSTRAPLEDGEKAVSCLDDLRAAASSVKPPEGFPDAFVWHRFCLFWESFRIMIEEMVRNVIIAASCVFVLVMLLTGSPFIGGLVTIAIGAVDVCLLGFMPLVGVDLNAVSIICIVVAIGFSVDYSAHIAHAFLGVSAEDSDIGSARVQRAAYALWRMGPAVVNGGVSTLIAVLPLCLGVSYPFRVFFKLFSLIVLFGLFFGVCALPLLLACVGPAPHSGAVDLSGAPFKNPLHPAFEQSGTEPDSELPRASQPPPVIEMVREEEKEGGSEAK